jgi:WhiB family redox-sensing transcriptional regulator
VTDWREQAACAGQPISLFFAPSGDGPGHVPPFDPAPALAFCARCPVTEQCLADAADRGDRGCVRGGHYLRTRLATARRTCPECRRRFTPTHPTNIYCDDPCADIARRRSHDASRRRRASLTDNRRPALQAADG